MDRFIVQKSSMLKITFLGLILRNIFTGSNDDGLDDGDNKIFQTQNSSEDNITGTHEPTTRLKFNGGYSRPSSKRRRQELHHHWTNS